MRRIAAVVFSVFVTTGAFAQTYNIPDFKTFGTAFQNFAEGIASALPLYSSIGNNWSSGYGGQLPHLGFGLTFGAATVPGTVVDGLLTDLGLPSVKTLFPSEAASLIDRFGVPLPGYVIEARIGGIILPFDLGLKFGYFGNKIQGLHLPANMKLDYTLAGFDIKVPIVKEGFLIPQVAVGAGFNYLHGFVSIPTSSSNISVGTITTPGGNYDVSFTAPNMEFLWDSKVIDAKVQVSKHLLIFTPYIGLGAAYGFSSAGGGISSELLINGSPANSTQIAYLNQALNALGQGSFTASNTSVLVQAGANGLGFRAFGGVSIDLLIVHVDMNLMYDFIGKNYGATLGARVQW